MGRYLWGMEEYDLTTFTTCVLLVFIDCHATYPPHTPTYTHLLLCLAYWAEACDLPNSNIVLALCLCLRHHLSVSPCTPSPTISPSLHPSLCLFSMLLFDFSLVCFFVFVGVVILICDTGRHVVHITLATLWMFDW